MTASSGWCLTDRHTHCTYPGCRCACHEQVDGQGELIPDPRTTQQPPF
jgi:hypothetical protein